MEKVLHLVFKKADGNVLFQHIDQGLLHRDVLGGDVHLLVVDALPRQKYMLEIRRVLSLIHI